MAGGNNASFMAHTNTFLQNHQLMISPQGIGSQGLVAGLMDIDLVSIDPRNAQFIRLENYVVPKKGLEPPHPCEYVDLNHARLPIPPLRHGT
jgi:hypothetical protein